MTYIGMVFQFDGTQGSGQMMFAEGEKREFTADDWVDGQNIPAVGQKVSYAINNNRAEIKVAGGDAVITSVPPLVQQTASSDTPSESEGFSSLDEYISHYTGMGFRLVKDTGSDGLRSLSFRKLENGDPIELIVTECDSEITVAQTVNGKSVPIS